MARIISAPLGEIRGKLGGMVFSRNQFGMIVRQHVQGVDPATPAQLNARQQLAQSAMLFRTLTPLQRAQWAQWAETSWIPLGKRQVTEPCRLYGCILAGHALRPSRIAHSYHATGSRNSNKNVQHPKP